MAAVLSRSADLAVLCVRALGTVAALKQGLQLPGLTLAIVACNVLGLFLNLRFARRVHQGLRLWPFLCFYRAARSRFSSETQL